MQKQDTCQLLKECNSGIKMAVDAIREVLPNVKNEELKNKLTTCEQEHEKLGDETHALLLKHHMPDDGKKYVLDQDQPYHVGQSRRRHHRQPHQHRMRYGRAHLKQIFK